MNVWLTVPSKRPAAEVEKWAQAWHDMGYKIALALDNTNLTSDPFADVVISDVAGYPGYARATNSLIRYLTERWPVDWFVIGGDDVYPDPTKRADEIAAECEDHFSYIAGLPTAMPTYGVMQPTGDRWGESAQSIDRYGPDRAAYIDRIAGSAWIGREAARRMYGGNGPLWPGYSHMFSDQELCEVAEKLGIYWRRRDLCQRHDHWGRGDGKTREDCPEFLREVSGPDHWEKFKAIYEERARSGFPGHEPSFD